MSSEKHVSRIQRVEKEIKQCLASLLINHLQRRWSGILTISRVKMPADLKSARVFITYLGEESDKKNILNTLKSEVKFLQGEVAKKLRLRYCPRITFDWDLGYESSLLVDKIIHELSSAEVKDQLNDPSDEEEA